MKNSAAALRCFLRCQLLMALAATALTTQAQVLTPYDPCADPNLSMQRNANGRYVVKWQAPAGATQLYWAPSLDQTATWQPVPGAIPQPGGFWQAEFLLNPPRAFFKVAPTAAPVPPPNVRLVMVGDHFRLEWDSTCDASGYAVYISTTPAPGPGNYLHRLPLPAANALEITGLTAGTRYYITIAATNLAGEGLTAPVLNGFYGPKAIYSGRAIQSFPMPTGDPFEVEAEGAVITLTLTGGGDGGVSFTATVNDRGEFRFPDLPPGSYIASWSWNGVSGVLPARIFILATGTQGTVFLIPIGFPAPSPANTLLGTVTLSTGDPARIAAPQFGLNAQATLTATFADNSTRIVTPDAQGSFAITQITGGFPVTLTATYQGLTTTTTIPATPVSLALHHLQFLQSLPTLDRLTMQQGGSEVQHISPGTPVTFTPEVTIPPGANYAPKWTVNYNGLTLNSTGPTFTYTFGGPGGPVVGPEGGTVRLNFATTDLTLNGNGTYTFFIDPPSGENCWTGMTGTWHPAAPNDILPANVAQVIVTHSAAGSPAVTASSTNQNGVTWFSTSVNPVKAAPYLVRVSMADHMRFLWPFEFRLPRESTFCVVPATITTHAQTSGSELTITRPGSDFSLILPYGSLRRDDDNTPWHGSIIVKSVVWNPLVRSPLPPGPELRGPGLRKGIHAFSGAWFDITTDGLVSLTPDASASLLFPLAHTPASIPVSHQVESTGYFERAGNGIRVDAARYLVSLGRKGLFLLGLEKDLLEPVLSADRSLNYPFDVLVNTSIFPVTVTGAGAHQLGHFYMPGGVDLRLRVLDLLQAPGLHYPVPADAPTTRPLEPMKKRVITLAEELPFVGGIAAPPAVAPRSILLTLGDAEPKLLTRPTDLTVKAIESKERFLTRIQSVPGAGTADAAAYYAKIKAPATLADWRQLNEFPPGFADPLPGAGLDTYATCYYYNLGDLGFARAQTMRITTGSDNQPNVAFAVTNYPSLEDAQCRRTPIATVCMDYALRSDAGAATPSRYTRYYVYDSAGKLLDRADLDAAGTDKFVPNLCVMCHGGTRYAAGGTTNLGSAFLPFDMASYGFHARYGVQKQEIAAMNAAVLKTQTTGAISNLIQGWYGHANPLAAPAVFQQNYVPVTGDYSWAGKTALYSDMFKHSCRVCHVSRDDRTRQIDSYGDLESLGFGLNSVCGAGMGMPNSQRTWGIFWGSRGANKLGATGVPNMPTILGNAVTPAQPCRE